MKYGEKKNLDSSKLAMKGIPCTHSIMGCCIFCGKGSTDTLSSEGLPYHSKCLTCPNCGEDSFVMWKPVKPYVARCLNCLHRWELLKEEEWSDERKR